MSEKLINSMADLNEDEAACKYVKAGHVCKNAQQTVEYCKKYMGV